MPRRCDNNGLTDLFRIFAERGRGRVEREVHNAVKINIYAVKIRKNGNACSFSVRVNTADKFRAAITGQRKFFDFFAHSSANTVQ